MYLNLILSFLSLVASALPALWPYLFVSDDKILIATIALYSVLSAAIAFSTCTLTDSIGRHITSNEKGPFKIGGPLVIFIVGFMVAMALNHNISMKIHIMPTLLLGMSGIINSIGEGVAKGVGKYKIHQYIIILNGILFVLISYALLKLEIMDDNLNIIALSRILALSGAFVIFLPQLFVHYNQSISISFRFDKAYSFTSMSIVGYINLIIERFFISKIATMADPNLGKFILATYQSISVMSGARGHIFSNYVKLAAAQVDNYFTITKKISNQFSILSVVLVPIGVMILLKGDGQYLKFEMQYIFVMACMITAFIIDIFSSKFGIFYTYNKKDKINLVCEIIGMVVMIVAYLLLTISYEILIIFVVIRCMQYIVRRVGYYYAYGQA